MLEKAPRASPEASRNLPGTFPEPPRAGASLSTRLEKARGGLVLQPDSEDIDKGEYVLVCGFGRVGQAVCELLTARLVRYKAFDMDPYRVAEARGEEE